MSESKTQWYLYEREEKGESRIEKLEQENERLKKALSQIQDITINNFDHDLHRIFKLAKEALENE